MRADFSLLRCNKFINITSLDFFHLFQQVYKSEKTAMCSLKLVHVSDKILLWRILYTLMNV